MNKVMEARYSGKAVYGERCRRHFGPVFYAVKHSLSGCVLRYVITEGYKKALQKKLHNIYLLCSIIQDTQF